MLVISSWLWSARSPGARLARLALVPTSLAYRGVMAARAGAYAHGYVRRSAESVPTVAVGNLTVGGSGKTPIAAWIAGYYRDQGRRPGVVLRGYGGDEGAIHRRLVPQAIVVEDGNRPRGIHEAVRRGAQVLVLDDAFQRLDVARDLDIAVVSAESSRAVPWTLPAGPWREPWTALRRADLVVVTRKRADRGTARAVVDRVQAVTHRTPWAIAHLDIGQMRGLRTRTPVRMQKMAGARIVVAAGVAEPRALAAQLEAIGASVRLLAFSDHHPFGPRDVARLVQLGHAVDYVVVTEKDAVKLERLWPEEAPEPVVASLEVVWEAGRERVEAALDAAVHSVAELLA